MKQNVGIADRTLRIFVGLVSIWLAVNYSPWWWILAIISFFTAFIGWCGLYSLLGINTYKLQNLRE